MPATRLLTRSPAPADHSRTQQAGAALRASVRAGGTGVRVIGFGDGTAPATVGMAVGLAAGWVVLRTV